MSGRKRRSDSEMNSQAVYASVTILDSQGKLLLSCQPRATVASCFVYKVIKYVLSLDHLCINPIRRIGLIHK